MGKYYENLSDLIELIKKFDKRNLTAELVLDCIVKTKENPELTPHEIIKIVKKKWLK